MRDWVAIGRIHHGGNYLVGQVNHGITLIEAAIKFVCQVLYQLLLGCNFFTEHECLPFYRFQYLKVVAPAQFA